MEYIYLAVSILMFVIGFLFGRKYVVVKREHITEDIDDIVNDVKEAISKPTARVISPRQLAEQRQFDKDLSEDL